MHACVDSRLSKHRLLLEAGPLNVTMCMIESTKLSVMLINLLFRCDLQKSEESVKEKVCAIPPESTGGYPVGRFVPRGLLPSWFWWRFHRLRVMLRESVDNVKLRRCIQI